MIKDEWIEAGKKAQKENRLEEYLDDLHDELGDNYTRSEKQRIIAQVAKEAKKAKGVVEENIEKILNDAFFIRGQSTIALNDLLNGKKRRLMQLHGPFNSQAFLTLANHFPNKDYFNAAKELVAQVESRMASRRGAQTLNLNRPLRALSGIDIGKSSDRDKVYDYWANIQGLHGEIVKAYDDFFKEMKPHLELGLFHEVKDVKPPNYLMELGPVTGRTTNALDKTLQALDVFLDRIGAVSEKEFVRLFADVNTEEGGPKQVGGSFEVEQIGDELEEMEENIEAHLLQPLDPMFAFMLNSGEIDLAYNVEEFQREILESIGAKAFEADLDILEKFNEFIDELEQGATKNERNKYYLPRHPEFDNEFERFETEANKFFTAFGRLVFEIPDRFALSQTHQKLGLGSNATPTKPEFDRLNAALTYHSAFPQKEGELRDMSVKAKAAYDELLQLVTNYYLIPLDQAAEYFLGDRPRFASLGEFRSLVMRAENHPLQFATKTLQEAASSDLDADDFEALSDFFEEISLPTATVDSDMLGYAEDALDSLYTLFGDKQDNEVWVGHLLAVIAEAQNQDLNALQFEGESLKEIYDDYVAAKKGQKYYAAELLTTFLESSQFKSKLPLVDSTVPLTDAKLQYEYRKGNQPEKIHFNAVKRLADVLDDLIKKADIPHQILHAHDLIRKMMGKPIVFGHMSLTNPDHMDIAMSSTKATAPEINLIVKSMDSFSNLGQKFGLNSEDIYTIKGMFR